MAGAAVRFRARGRRIGFAETAESTLVAQMLPDRLRGNGFGVLGLVQSLGDLASSLVVGLLWAASSATVAFAYAGAWMLASVACSRLLRPIHRSHSLSSGDADDRDRA